jgi:hypothetical protein
MGSTAGGVTTPTVLVTASPAGGPLTLAARCPVSPDLPRASDDTGNGQSQIGYFAPVPGFLSGTPHTHPLWDGELQLNDLHDVGVVVLDTPYLGATPARRFTEAVGQNASSQVLKPAENANDSRAGGGSCFGDSGGPVFHDGLLVGDTSFGASQFCRSFGGYYRLDIEDARSFLDDFVAVP